MKKVFLNGWAAKNLGDDLFFKIITDRYKNIFYLSSVNHYPKINNNLKIINSNNVIIRCIRKILRIIFKIELDIKKRLENKSDIMVTVGGSLFIENKSNDYNKLYLKSLTSNKKPYFILGSNVGPYKNSDYINQVNDLVIKNSVDTCFRDTKSKQICNLDKIRVAPDIVFSMNTDNYNLKEKKSVVISVINCEEKASQIGDDYTVPYENKLVEIIEYFLQEGYEIVLMSFCSFEKDTDTIQRIMNKFNNEKIGKYIYNGNINEALKIIAQSEIVIGTRFHANILGLLFNKKVLPFSYNEKTINTLKDINFQGDIIKFSEIQDFDVKNLKNLKKQNIDFQKLKAYAEKHFEILDKYLERK